MPVVVDRDAQLALPDADRLAEARPDIDQLVSRVVLLSLVGVPDDRRQRVPGRVKAPKTDASTAIVRLDDETSEALEREREVQRAERDGWGEAWTDTGLVFTHEDGTAWHPDQLSKAFLRLAFAAGLPPIRLHDLRHCAATLALAGGADITAVSRLPRHGSIQITADIYAEVLPELASEVASKVVRMVPRQRSRGTGVVHRKLGTSRGQPRLHR